MDEIELPEDVVRALLRRDAPDVAALPLTPMGRGWDNDLWRLGGHLAVRLPRRPDAAHLVVREHRWLPLLAPRLPLPVPAPVRLGEPGFGYPWRWTLVPYLPGEIAARTPPASAEESARALAGFLAALHVPAPDGAPRNPNRGVPLAGRHDVVLRRTDDLARGIDTDAVLRAWGVARAAPAWNGPALWVHGDLHPGNLLVLDGRLRGVVDFGALTAGDPATDLAVAWMLLPRRERELFRTLYASAAPFGLDEATWARASGWCVAMALAFVGHDDENPMMAALGRRSLAEVLR